MFYPIGIYLAEASNIQSTSGCEANITKWFAKKMSSLTNNVHTDILGNVIAHKAGNNSLKIMLVAHADEIGFMVTNIDERGFMSIRPIGGVDASVMPGTMITICGYKETIMGCVGKNAIHLQKDEPSAPKFEELWVDIGCASKEEAQAKIRIGDYATFTPNYYKQSESVVCSKSLDDRVGIAVLLCLAERLKDTAINCDLYLVASVQEELGMRGAQVATNAIRPDICIAIDVTHANDYPSARVVTTDIKLGKGTVITIGPNVDTSIGKGLVNQAESNGIDYQIEPIPCPTGTDARVVQNSCLGVRTAVLSIPCRYMHTPTEMVSLKDAEDTICLLHQYITSL